MPARRPACAARFGRVTIAGTVMALSASAVWAQPPERDGSRGGMLRPTPLMAALDADGNGEISREEMVTRLMEYDADKDGKLTREELAAMRLPGGREGGRREAGAGVGEAAGRRPPAE